MDDRWERRRDEKIAIWGNENNKFRDSPENTMAGSRYKNEREQDT